MQTNHTRPEPRRILTRAVAAAGMLVVLALVSCGPEFDPYWRVNKFRVIAIQADPVTLKEGESTTLTAETFDPQDREVTYEWEWCPLDTDPANEWRCPLTAEDLQAAVDEQTPEGQPAPEIPDDFFEIGEGQSVQFAYPGTQDLILGFCEAVVAQVREASEDSPLAGALPVVDCNRGFDISVRLVATAGGEAEIVARKKLTLFTGNERFDNQNPDVFDIQIQPRKESDIARASAELDWVQPESEPRDSRWVSIPEDEPLPVLAGLPYDIRAQVEPNSVEIWTPPAPVGADEEYLPPESEVIEYRWLLTTAGLEESDGLFVDSQNTLLGASESGITVNYKPDTTDYDEDGVDNATDNCPPYANRDQLDSNDDGIGDACDIYVWSVIRDGRLGIDWVRRTLRVSKW